MRIISSGHLITRRCHLIWGTHLRKEEFQSVLGPVGVQNQESGLPRTDEESTQSGVVPSMSGNDYTVPIASSPVAKGTEVEGLPEMTLSPSEPLRRSTRIRKPVVRLNL